MLRLLKYHSGNIHFLGKHIEIALMKELLKKYYDFKIISESKDSIKCKIIRKYRGFFYPYLGPHTRLSIKIEKDLANSFIKYDYFWPEYIWAFICSFPVGLIGFYPDLLLGFAFSLFLLIFISVLIFLDTRSFAKCFKGLVQELKKQL